jgi:hypothetical protein
MDSDAIAKPYVHVTIDAVDAVVFDPENQFDADRHDRYATFVQARDAALTSIEAMLDAADYDGDDHRDELERMHRLLEPAEVFGDVEHDPAYCWFIDRLKRTQTQTVAA